MCSLQTRTSTGSPAPGTAELPLTSSDACSESTRRLETLDIDVHRSTPQSFENAPDREEAPPSHRDSSSLDEKESNNSVRLWPTASCNCCLDGPTGDDQAPLPPRSGGVIFAVPEQRQCADQSSPPPNDLDTEHPPPSSPFSLIEERARASGDLADEEVYENTFIVTGSITITGSGRVGNVVLDTSVASLEEPLRMPPCEDMVFIPLCDLYRAYKGGEPECEGFPVAHFLPSLAKVVESTVDGQTVLSFDGSVIPPTCAFPAQLFLMEPGRDRAFHTELFIEAWHDRDAWYAQQRKEAAKDSDEPNNAGIHAADLAADVYEPHPCASGSAATSPTAV